MIARLHLILPFSLTLAEGETYTIHPYEDGGYRVSIYPPVRSDQPAPGIDADELYIDQKPAFEANALRIDFHKDSFDRREEIDCDPPPDLIQRTLTLFLRKLRFVTRGPKITLVSFPRGQSWEIRYLNDDGTNLPPSKGLVDVRGTRALKVSYVALTPRIWDDTSALPIEFAPPEWDSLYLDALAALPDVGQSIVLAATSLEVFISYVLDALAPRTLVPPQLWDWIKGRGPQREPTLEEQFDDLLNFALGSTLKDNPALWQSFQNIRKARNSFVHEGIAKIGKEPVGAAQARELVHRAAEIMDFLKAKLPEEMRWRAYQYAIAFEFKKGIFGPAS